MSRAEHSNDRPWVRRRFSVDGMVQGVGFRPFVYGLANELGLTGFVLNNSSGVLIEVEGARPDVDEFGSALIREPPPLAVIDAVVEQELTPVGSTSFEIRSSESGGEPRTAISPDIATCPECLAEISDPWARRFGYEFTNCTNCGPRFTITRSVPYDRPATTMAAFEMCARCRAEYEDPADRRFHAQPIACPDCGPHVRLLEVAAEDGGERHDPVSSAARMIRAGHILAVKGLGGYHLACDARNETAVEELRRRKHREEKPFAVMVPSLDAALDVAAPTREEIEIMTSSRRPIVLVRRRETSELAASIAPGNRCVGLMLPYTPLHHLLLREVGGPVVLTSGNHSDEPIAFRDRDALERLSPLVDAVLVHDRAIHVRCDDSVVRVVDGREYQVRRSRGYAPEPLRVSQPFLRPVVAAGPELKHTFCLGNKDRAILSHHIGDLENIEAMTAFVDGVEHFTRIFEVDPEVVAYDLHPEYLATKWAQEQELDKVGVQHHHAHIASCLADNLRAERTIGLALDGTGFGDDGTIWGCEVLDCDLSSYDRAGHLAYVPMPGGAAAVREPWRMAAVYLSAAFGAAAERLPLDFVTATVSRWPPILKMASAGLNAPLTSSAGRLFDAVAAVCGLRERVSYEGQAAAELEQVVEPGCLLTYPCSIEAGVINGVELVAAAAEDLAAGRPIGEVAAGFHRGLAGALVRVCEDVRDRRGLELVALSGGSFQNLVLLHATRDGLQAAGFEVLVHRRVPTNDGGISLGQAVVANARVAAGRLTPSGLAR